MTWSPKRSLLQANNILCAPGTPYELETRLVAGRIQRVYKHLWPSLREFWTIVARQYADKTYVVLDEERVTFQQLYHDSLRAACMFRDAYGIQKGDRVAICSRNYPEYLTAFWACHMIGAVSVLINAWLPLPALHHCIAHTGCKLVLLDPERASVLEESGQSFAHLHAIKGYLVFKLHQGKGTWKGMKSWVTELNAPAWQNPQLGDIDIQPEDNATIFFTSGTTGMPKGVLSTQRMYLTNIINLSVAPQRALLRRGEGLATPATGPQRGQLIGVPFFHVTGLTSLAMSASLLGQKIVLMKRWSVDEAVRLIKTENIAASGGVPSMALDLIESSLGDGKLEMLSFGGAPAPDSLVKRAVATFPSTLLGQGYGLTETNSLAVCVAGEDYIHRPKCCGLPTPINDVIIMDVQTGLSVPPRIPGEVWIRGPNIMKEYWNDPVATNKVLTQDGWFKSGDLGYLDEEGFLYILDRLKDVIIRGGENIDSVTIENALYTVDGVMEAAAIGIPDERLGELPAAVVFIKPDFQATITEAALLDVARKSLPKFAVPVLILIRGEPLGGCFSCVSIPKVTLIGHCIRA
ncbi:hypothetical protein AX16_003208 [Volvariella volvacea WC 439]|nr:hypothetical protein AX16_003208 [Volvariella volvacea WC 439]